MSFLGGGGKGSFDRLLEAATSQILLEPCWSTNLEICDSIRQKDVTASYAVSNIRKKIKDTNPHVTFYALVVMETCVKNCGQPFHEEIKSHEFMDDLRTLAQMGSSNVKEKVLEMLQAWSHAFRNKTQFQPILATYNLMKMEGYEFPDMKESDAMFSADAAPLWKEGDVCNLCRVKFSLMTRQHHCRACGEVFCSKCSSKSSIVPKIGIEREVRVCDTCYDEINPNATKPDKKMLQYDDDSELPQEYLNSDLYKEKQTTKAPTESEKQAQEEEEALQLAMALSLSEEENNKNSPSKNWSSPVKQPLHQSTTQPVEQKQSSLYFNSATSLPEISDNQSELAQYMNRSYWEKKNAELKSHPSAPVVSSNSEPQYGVVNGTEEYVENEDVDDNAAFVENVEKSIEMFVQRMNTVSQKGKHIALDSTIQSLFTSLTAMHPQLLRLIEDEDESTSHYEAMLKKLAVIREARESLNDMRAQHIEKTRQQELEQEMLRRMQMEQKLELMRQQKQEFLEYQHTLQLQRQQDLEYYQQEKLQQQSALNRHNYEGYPVVMNGKQIAGYASEYETSQHVYGYDEYDSNSVPPPFDEYATNIVPPPSYDSATQPYPQPAYYQQKQDQKYQRHPAKFNEHTQFPLQQLNPRQLSTQPPFHEPQHPAFHSKQSVPQPESFQSPAIQILAQSETQFQQSPQYQKQPHDALADPQFHQRQPLSQAESVFQQQQPSSQAESQFHKPHQRQTLYQQPDAPSQPSVQQPMNHLQQGFQPQQNPQPQFQQQPPHSKVQPPFQQQQFRSEVQPQFQQQQPHSEVQPQYQQQPQFQQPRSEIQPQLQQQQHQFHQAHQHHSEVQPQFQQQQLRSEVQSQIQQQQPLFQQQQQPRSDVQPQLQLQQPQFHHQLQPHSEVQSQLQQQQQPQFQQPRSEVQPQLQQQQQQPQFQVDQQQPHSQVQPQFQQQQPQFQQQQQVFENQPPYHQNQPPTADINQSQYAFQHQQGALSANMKDLQLISFD